MPKSSAYAVPAAQTTGAHPAGALPATARELEVPMHTHSLDKQGSPDNYLFGRRQAWFAFAMTIALMVFDYVDRQVIVSLFPHMKQDWGLSDKELGALVSVVSITDRKSVG